ncbi:MULTISPECIES: sensor histidine kinase [unclassified Luteococcus]|uniref:sensor histidine kinase n=1 Tax=unclassified Luteococcus TaxID=2639923 RepID=UPI00313ED666
MISTVRSSFDELGHATWALDLAVAGLLFVFTVIPMALGGLGGGQGADALLIGTGMCAAVVTRRRFPMLTLLLITLLCILHALTLTFPIPSLVSVLLVSYSVARWVPGHRSRVVLVLGAIGAIVGPLPWVANYAAGMAMLATAKTLYVLTALLCLGLVVTCYAIGRRVRESAEASRARILAEAERRALELSEREQAARMTEATIRAQIARELHDIVAHSLSVMIVQAEGGRALAAKKPEQAPMVLDTIAETGREALTEMRRIVGVLRGGVGEDAAFAPTPGLPDIPEMVARSGDRVHLYVEGTPPVVPPTLGLTAFRVVQEAVTNFLKHAGPDATATVTLTYSAQLIVAEISDDGLGAEADSDGRGHGLQGMRERVVSMHGQLLAQPKATGGFLVRAILPVPLALDSLPAQEMP